MIVKGEFEGTAYAIDAVGLTASYRLPEGKLCEPQEIKLINNSVVSARYANSYIVAIAARDGSGFTGQLRVSKPDGLKLREQEARIGRIPFRYRPIKRA